MFPLAFVALCAAAFVAILAYALGGRQSSSADPRIARNRDAAERFWDRFDSRFPQSSEYVRAGVSWKVVARGFILTPVASVMTPKDPFGPSGFDETGARIPGCERAGVPFKECCVGVICYALLERRGQVDQVVGTLCPACDRYEVAPVAIGDGLPTLFAFGGRLLQRLTIWTHATAEFR